MNVEQFIDLHGGPYVMPRTGRIFLLADGAAIGSGGEMYPPAHDSRHRLRARRLYHFSLLEQAQKELAALEAALRPGGQVFAGPWAWPDDRSWFRAHVGNPAPNAEAALTTLRSIVVREEREVAELDRQLGPEPAFACP